MGVFSTLDMERQYSGPQGNSALSGFADDDESVGFTPQSQGGPEEMPAEQSSAQTAAPVSAGTAAATADGGSEEPTAKEDEDAKRKAHEEAEAKRKAEFDARQAAKKAAEQEQLAKVAAMGDDEVMAASMRRVSADTEKLTRRNMKECVAEYIQTKCIEDPAFARLTMHPVKSMIHCFWYINRKAREFAEQEMEDNDIKQEGVYGTDVPDDLCYQWAEEYFRDPDAEEDHRGEEKFVPKPYYGGTTKAKSKTKEKKKAEKKTEKPKAPPKDDGGQLSLLGAAS